MSAEGGFDMTRLNMLREELRQLNEVALADGLVGSRDGRLETPQRQRRRTSNAHRLTAGAARDQSSNKSADGPSSGKASSGKTSSGKTSSGKTSPDAGKAASRRLLAMGARTAGDTSPVVPGTDFSEAGVARLLVNLRRPRRRRVGAWHRFRQQIERYLSRPVSSGLRSAAGVSIERLQVLSRQLHDIDRNGWSRFQEKRMSRRRRPTATGDEPS